jgi:hypothetical protein
MDNHNDYIVAFALVGMAEAIAQVLGSIKSQTRQTRKPERLCTRCGKLGHRAPVCTAAPIEQPVVATVVTQPVATATVQPKTVTISDALSPAEAARITKIRVPGSRYRPQALGVADVKAIERVRCCGETHRLALLNNGQVAILDHPRKLFKLQGWAARSAGLKAPDGCWAKLAWLQENVKRAYGDHGMLSRAVAEARERDEKQQRERNPVEHERGKSYLKAERAHELAQHATSVERWRKEAHAVVRVAAERFGNPSITHVQGAGHPTLYKHIGYSGRTRACTLRMNVIRWFVTVFKKNHANIAKNAMVLEVLDTDVIGRPSRVTALRKGKGGVECIEALVKYGQSGAARFVATATLTVKGGY